MATSFHKVLEGARGQKSEYTLRTLERCAMQKMQEFKPQEIANTLLTMTKYSYKPTEPLLLALERRAEAISGEFNSQSVANTLWAFATMGTKPGERTENGDKAGGSDDGTAGATGGDDIRGVRGVQLAVCCKHAVGVYDNGDKAGGVCDNGYKVGGADDGVAGAVGGGDIRGVHLTVCCKHVVGVCDNGDKVGGAEDGAVGAAGGGDIRGVYLAVCCKHAIVVVASRGDLGFTGATSVFVSVGLRCWSGGARARRA